MPATLQTLEPRNSRGTPKTPLVLIHDGGGTIFQYFLLGPFGRETCGIANPYFDQGGKPLGGIKQLAQEYADAIWSHVGKGPLILGGWSFGGMLSLEVARILAGDANVKIIGLLMIDSMCPWSDSFKQRGRVRPSYRENTTEAMKSKVNQSFDSAGEMLADWPPPPSFKVPPTILIRANESMTIKNSVDGAEGVRDEDGQLGWTVYGSFEFTQVIHVPGDHFSMFSDDKLDGMTARINEACSLLDKDSASNMP